MSQSSVDILHRALHLSSLGYLPLVCTLPYLWLLLSIFYFFLYKAAASAVLLQLSQIPQHGCLFSLGSQLQGYLGYSIYLHVNYWSRRLIAIQIWPSFHVFNCNFRSTFNFLFFLLNFTWQFSLSFFNSPPPEISRNRVLQRNRHMSLFFK